MAYSGKYLPHSSWNALPRRQIICDWSAPRGWHPGVGGSPRRSGRPSRPIHPDLVSRGCRSSSGPIVQNIRVIPGGRAHAKPSDERRASASYKPWPRQAAGLLQCRPSSDRDRLARESVSRSERTPGLWAPTWCSLQPPDGPHPAAIFQCEWGPPIDEDRFTKFPQLRAPVSSCKWGASLVYRPQSSSVQTS